MTCEEKEDENIGPKKNGPFKTNCKSVYKVIEDEYFDECSVFITDFIDKSTKKNSIPHLIPKVVKKNGRLLWIKCPTL